MSEQLNNNWHSIAQNGDKLWFDNQRLHQVTEQWFDADFWRDKQSIVGQSKGRYITYFVETKDKANKPIELVLRHYYRGGLISKLSKRTFIFSGFTKTRAYQELLLLSQMKQRGLPVPTPIAARVTRTLPWLCQGDILIERIDGAQDLFHYLSKQPLPAHLWQQVGSTIKQFHQQGVFHSDLNIHNILLDDKGKLWLIDFDRCGFKVKDQKWQQANLDRLKRSLEKELGLNSNFAFKQENWQQLMMGYQA